VCDQLLVPTISLTHLVRGGSTPHNVLTDTVNSLATILDSVLFHK
jgi:hypothetical protein